MRKKKLERPYKLASRILANGQEGILREVNQYRGLLSQTTLFQNAERRREEKYTECFANCQNSTSRPRYWTANLNWGGIQLM